VHLSNLCTEILEVTNQAETAVCNLGSVNLSAHGSARRLGEPAFDFERLGEVVRLALPFLDRVVDINFYPTDAAGNSNDKWRPVGLGIMGLQDVFFKLKLPFDSPEARALSARISEEIYFHALTASATLSEASGPHGGFDQTRAAKGDLQFDLWGVTPTDTDRWDALKRTHRQHGLRNSLMIAIAPTATIASIAGCYECIEPQVSNLFKRETLSGEFLQINTYLVRELQSRGLWNEDIIGAIKRSEGSIAQIEEIPAEIRERFRTAWELPMRSADRHGRRPWRLHRPEPVAQPVHGVPEHRQVVLDVPVCVEAGLEDHLLPAVPPGDPHQPDQHHEVGTCGEGHRRRRRQLLAGEPRELRFLSVARVRVPRHL
jgi:ribonucleoside-diphosphate reductase alpha chain